MNTAEIIIMAHDNGLSMGAVLKVCIALGEEYCQPSTEVEYTFEDGSIIQLGETLQELPF